MSRQRGDQLVPPKAGAPGEQHHDPLTLRQLQQESLELTRGRMSGVRIRFAEVRTELMGFRAAHSFRTA